MVYHPRLDSAFYTEEQLLAVGTNVLFVHEQKPRIVQVVTVDKWDRRPITLRLW